MSKVFIGGDHAGFALKASLIPYLKELGHEVEDLGALTLDTEDDYPDYASAVASAVVDNEGSYGVLACGSGQGEAMVANRVKGVRAAVFYGEVPAKGVLDIEGTEAVGAFDIVRLARAHNNSNILTLGSRFITEEEGKEAVHIFLTTPFKAESRHQRRIEKF